MSEDTDFLKEAKNMQGVAFYSAEHDRMANAQAYATIALAQAVIALVERIDGLTCETWERELPGIMLKAIQTVQIQ